MEDSEGVSAFSKFDPDSDDGGSSEALLWLREDLVEKVRNGKGNKW